MTEFATTVTAADMRVEAERLFQMADRAENAGRSFMHLIHQARRLSDHAARMEAQS